MPFGMGVAEVGLVAVVDGAFARFGFAMKCQLLLQITLDLGDPSFIPEGKNLSGPPFAPRAHQPVDEPARHIG